MHACDGVTDGQRDGRTELRYSIYAVARKNSVGEAHVVLPRFTNLATPTVSDESEVYGGWGAEYENMILDPGRHKPSRRHCLCPIYAQEKSCVKRLNAPRYCYRKSSVSPSVCLSLCDVEAPWSVAI